MEPVIRKLTWANVMSLTVPWVIGSWAPWEVTEVRKESVHRRNQKTEELRDTMGKRRGIRREERDTGEDEIFLHWFLCGKPIIPIPLKRLGR